MRVLRTILWLGILALCVATTSCFQACRDPGGRYATVNPDASDEHLRPGECYSRAGQICRTYDLLDVLGPWD